MTATPEPTLVEYRLARVEQAMDKVTDAIQDFRVDLATKAEVEAVRQEAARGLEALEARVDGLEKAQAAQRPWAAPAAAGGGLLAVLAMLGTAWQAAHGG